MKLSDWTNGGSSARDTAARSHSATLLRNVAGALDDTVVFGTAEYGQSTDAPLVVTLWAATRDGFATARVTTNPDPGASNERAGVSLFLQAWRTIDVLTLAGVSPLSDPLAPTLMAGSISISSTADDAQELVELYRACAGFLGA
jgi:hypothetical protein